MEFDLGLRGMVDSCEDSSRRVFRFCFHKLICGCGASLGSFRRLIPVVVSLNLGIPECTSNRLVSPISTFIANSQNWLWPSEVLPCVVRLGFTNF